jgi:HEAT repeat protein
MEYLVFALLFGLVSSAIASQKGRSAPGFFVLGVLLGPIGTACALIVSKDESVVQAELLLAGTLTRCPFCAELVQSKALVCRSCGRDLPVFAQIGPHTSTGELIDQLNSVEPRIRERAIIALGDRGAMARDAIPALLAMRDDADDEVRQRSRWAVERIGRG